ncbi:MAG: TIGR00730 family Rossman fold protein [Deltaproteobacteria bacterium]|nr:TIGR00730 family Rossman fold protein [Deltaproteobacteria bacterium]
MNRIKRIDKHAAYEVFDQLLDQVCPEADPTDRRHMRQLLYTAVLVAQDQPGTLNLKIMNRSLRELRRGFNTFAPWSDYRKIAVFGSARTAEDDAHYSMAVECAKGLVDAGFMVVTGAGPGIMEAANRGAGRDNSFGVNILLPFEAQANDYIIDDPKLVNFKYFFTRKVVFVKETDGVILFPGGFGTQDEGFETLTLIQTGKTDPRPVVMIEQPGSTYWEEWDRYIRTALLERGLISEDDLELYEVVNDSAAAIRHVSHFYRNFHSIRYIENRLVIRLKHPPAAGTVEMLNDEFQDIVESGKIEEVDRHSVEDDEPADDLFRLRLHFDQRHLGRLRRMIERLNDAVTDEQVLSKPDIKPVHGITPEAERDADDDE